MTLKMWMPPKGHRKYANQLRRGLGIGKLSYEDGLRGRWGDATTVINCGNAVQDTTRLIEDMLAGHDVFGDGMGPVVYNRPEAVALAVAKTDTLILLTNSGVPTLDYSFYQHEALRWAQEGHVVYCRTLTRGSGGAGIVVAHTPEEIVGCHLYTKRFKGKEEYRIHVGPLGTVIQVQQKRKRKGVEGNKFVKNHSNGYVFCQQDVNPPEEVIRAAISAVDALRLHFGAVDVGYAPTTGAVCVFEVNTRPALEGTTLQKYIEYFRNV